MKELKEITLYHGGRSLEDNINEYKGTKGKIEYGPGLYLTSNIDTAKEYSKGGGTIYELKIELENDVGYMMQHIEKKKIKLYKAIIFLEENLPNKKKKEYFNYLEKNFKRMNKEYIQANNLKDIDLLEISKQDKNKELEINAEVLNNLAINMEVIAKTEKATKLWNNFFLENNIDCSFVQNYNGGVEDVLALFNLKKIKEIKKIKYYEYVEIADKKNEENREKLRYFFNDYSKKLKSKEIEIIEDKENSYSTIRLKENHSSQVVIQIEKDFEKTWKDTFSNENEEDSIEEIEGYLKEFSDTKEYAFIQYLNIDKDLRRMGIGSYLLKKAEKYIKEQNIKTILLNAEPQEGEIEEYELMAFYKENGYVEIKNKYEDVNLLKKEIGIEKSRKEKSLKNKIKL
jgi:ribosomal protein S18 acetylase RimI-like enzyme